MFDKEDFIKARDRLKRSLIRFIVCFGIMMLCGKWIRMIPQEGTLFTALAWTGGLAILGHIYYFWSILFRIRFVLQRMGEGAGLWQLGVLFIPYIGVVILPMIVISKANKFLASQS